MHTRGTEPLLEGFVEAARRHPPRLERDLTERVMGRVQARSRTPRLLAAAILVPAAAMLVLLVFAPSVPPGDGEGMVTFTLRAAEARSVSLVGDFNGWQPGRDPLRRDGDSWAVTRRLARGSFQKYAFLVDGELVVPDQDGVERVDDGFGGLVALVFVR